MTQPDKPGNDNRILLAALLALLAGAAAFVIVARLT
ncbi:MAG: hypothetical protein QOF12_1906, partial [Solirubrobacteraceae bacterium]|nr:hypothetical protein [Solirubrobacteraceae bacterium]